MSITVLLTVGFLVLGVSSSLGVYLSFTNPQRINVSTTYISTVLGPDGGLIHNTYLARDSGIFLAWSPHK